MGIADTGRPCTHLGVKKLGPTGHGLPVSSKTIFVPADTGTPCTHQGVKSGLPVSAKAIFVHTKV